MRDNPTVEFGGGLGDTILGVYRRNAMELLDAATRPHNVLMLCHNPHAMELFRWHPNNGHFVLLDMQHKCREFGPREVVQKIYEFLDLPLERRTGNMPATRRPVFHSVDQVADAGHLVFQPYAGTSIRWLPPALIDRLLQAFARIDRTVYVITHSYIRASGPGARHMAHQHETFPFDLPPNVRHLDALSVPATLQLIRDSSGFIGTHSCMALAAWSEDKQAAVFYNPGNADFVVPGQGYSFGATRPNCYCADFDAADVEQALSTLLAGSPPPTVLRAALRSRCQPYS